MLKPILYTLHYIELYTDGMCDSLISTVEQFMRLL